jgi:hypothetical protein
MMRPEWKKLGSGFYRKTGVGDIVLHEDHEWWFRPKGHMLNRRGKFVGKGPFRTLTEAIEYAEKGVS